MRKWSEVSAEIRARPGARDRIAAHVTRIRAAIRARSDTRSGLVPEDTGHGTDDTAGSHERMMAISEYDWIATGKVARANQTRKAQIAELRTVLEPLLHRPITFIDDDQRIACTFCHASIETDFAAIEEDDDGTCHLERVPFPHNPGCAVLRRDELLGRDSANGSNSVSLP